MATGLKSRIIYKEHTANGSWTGKYKLLIRAKSIPSPIGTRNMVDTTTNEDEMETQEFGRRAAASMAVQGAMDKEILDDINALGEKKLDIICLYGKDGLGSIAKYAFEGTVDASPDDADGDTHLTMTANVAVMTVPVLVTDQYTITYDASSKEFTVATV